MTQRINLRDATWARVPHAPEFYGPECSDEYAQRLRGGILAILRAYGWGNEIEHMAGTTDAGTIIYAPDYTDGDDVDEDMMIDDDMWRELCDAAIANADM